MLGVRSDLAEISKEIEVINLEHAKMMNDKRRVLTKAEEIRLELLEKNKNLEINEQRLQISKKNTEELESLTMEILKNIHEKTQKKKLLTTKLESTDDSLKDIKENYDLMKVQIEQVKDKINQNKAHIVTEENKRKIIQDELDISKNRCREVKDEYQFIGDPELEKIDIQKLDTSLLNNSKLSKSQTPNTHPKNKAKPNSPGGDMLIEEKNPDQML